MTCEVINFPRQVGDAIKRSTVKCNFCESRAMRIVTADDGENWAVECHNCGELMENMEIKWEPSGTAS